MQLKKYFHKKIKDIITYIILGSFVFQPLVPVFAAESEIHAVANVVSVVGNGNLENGQASIILNEITGRPLSSFNGFMEIAGSGFGLINTRCASLVTGKNKAEYSASSNGINVNTSAGVEYSEKGVTANIDVKAEDEANSTTQEMKINPEKTEGIVIKENNEYYRIQGGEKVKVPAEDVEGKRRYYVEGQGWYENVNGVDTYVDENRIIDGKQWRIDKNGQEVYIGEVPEAFHELSKEKQDIVLKLTSAESIADKVECLGHYFGQDWKERIDVFWKGQYNSAISNGMTPALAGVAADFTTGEVIAPVIEAIISKGGVVAAELGALEGKLNAASKGTNNVGTVVEGPSKAGTLSNLETRQWYLQQEAKIPELINKNLSLEKQARQAVDLRNKFRTQARELMADREMAASLNRTDKNLTWEEVVKKYTEKGFQGDDLYREIVNSAQRSRTSINKSLGIE